MTHQIDDYIGQNNPIFGALAFGTCLGSFAIGNGLR